MQIKYVIITPVRDEETYLKRTVDSVISQIVRPAEYVLVNDGSSDRTGEIIDQYCHEHSWIRAIHRSDRGYRKWGGGIIEAFYAGFKALNCQDWDFMCKLDGDLSFDSEYFAGAIRKFEENPKIGIGGGVLYHYKNGRRILEGNPPKFHVRGGVKIYRRRCWEEIGGLWVGPGSDTVDEVKANMLGWTTMSFGDLHLIHHRPTGASWGRWGSLVKDGRVDYVYGSHPAFLMAKALVRLFQRPYVIGSMGLVFGYITAFFQRCPRVDDPQLIRYLRGQQLARLMGRKTIWK
jgi:glycosyltransferase involved in cell wall biosynthesis